MDPEMARLAMEQMRKMSPEQIAAMRAQMGNMDPSMMQAAMAQMNSMSDSDKERMRREMASMDASQMGDIGSQGAARMSQQHKYELQASEMLKSEGNTLHKTGRFKEAAEKYKRAHANMATHSSPEAKALSKACALNLASCYLKLENFDDAVTMASKVLATERSNVKALYRRGQAYMGLKAYGQAVMDLSNAVSASPGDEAVKSKLEEAKGLLNQGEGVIVEEPDEHDFPTTSPPPQMSGTTRGDPAQAASMMKDPTTRKMISEMMKGMSDDDLMRMAAVSGAPPGMTPQQMRQQYEMLSSMDHAEVERMASMAAAAGGRAPPATPGGPPDAEQFKKMKEMMDKDPDAMKKVMDTMSQMPPEQLEAIAKASGAPTGMKLTPEMVKMSADMMKNMTPEDMKSMHTSYGDIDKADASTSSYAPQPTMNTASTTTKHDDVEIEDITGQEDAGNTSTSSRAAPSSMPSRGMADMLSGMSEEQLSSMAQMSGMPPGMMTPEMIKMAADMMKNMDPAEIMRMQQMAAGMGGQGPGQSGGAEGLTDMQKAKMQADVMNNPESVKMMSRMMESMDPKTLAAMSKQAGMEISEEQAAKMKDMLKNVKPEHMEKIMKVAGFAQRAGQKAKRAKELMFSREMFWFSLVMLFLAILLRYLGLV